MDIHSLNSYSLNTNWCLWYHSINDTNWTNSSYKNLYTIRSENVRIAGETLNG